MCIEKGIEIHFIVATSFSYLLWIASQYALPMLLALSFSSFHFFSMPYRNSQMATWPVPYRKWDFILKILWKISSSSITIVIEYGQQKTCYIERQEIQAIRLFIMTKRLEKPAVLSKTEAWKPEKLQSKKIKPRIAKINTQLHWYNKNCIDTGNTKKDSRGVF